ncbi:hypothetical protein ACH3XW_4145 [Acanthocheilonema viteae]
MFGMIKLYETVIITVIITLLPLIFLAPMITFEFLERKRQKMFQFLLEFRPKNFVFSESSISDDQFKKEKQLSENVNRSREEIRAILSARNHLSPRELLSLMCTSPTQQSSSCIAKRKNAKKLRRYRRNVITDSTDMHVLSRKHSSSTSSSESTSSTKKSSTTIDKFEKLSVGRDVNSKAAESTKSFSESESKNLLKPKS